MCDKKRRTRRTRQNGKRYTARKKKFYGRQASDERLYMRREEGGKGLVSFKDVYARTEVTVACYMAASTDKWIKAVWANECSKEHTSTKKIAEEVMAEIKVDVEFGMGNIYWKRNGR